MANWCEIEMYITGKTPDDARKIHEALQESYKEAQKENVSMYVGSTSKYLFSSDFDLIDDSVYLHGNVKWSLEYHNAVEWIQWLKSHGEIVEIKARYRESGNCVYGQYGFDGTFLYDEYLPWEYFPKYDENDPDSRDHLLEAALKEHGVDVIVAQIAA